MGIVSSIRDKKTGCKNVTWSKLGVLAHCTSIGLMAIGFAAVSAGAEPIVKERAYIENAMAEKVQSFDSESLDKQGETGGYDFDLAAGKLFTIDPLSYPKVKLGFTILDPISFEIVETSGNKKYWDPLAVSPDGRYMVATGLPSGSWSGETKLHVFDRLLNTDKEINGIIAPWIEDVDATNTQAVVSKPASNINKDDLLRVDLAEAKITKTADIDIYGPSKAKEVVYSKDGKSIFVEKSGGIVRVDSESMKVVSESASLTTAQETKSIALSPNGHYLYVASPEANLAGGVPEKKKENRVVVLNTKSLSETKRLYTKPYAQGGKSLFVATPGKKDYEVKYQSPFSTLKAQMTAKKAITNGYPFAIAVAGNANRLLVCVGTTTSVIDEKGTLVSLDLSTLAPLKSKSLEGGKKVIGPSGCEKIVTDTASGV